MSILYDVLDINKKATKQEIKKAYRNKAKTCHPDVSSNKGEEFALISKAYAVLKDDGKRQRYDAGEDVNDIMKPTLDRPTSIILKILSETLQAEDVDPRTQDIILTIKMNIESFIKNVEKEIKKLSKIEGKFETFLENIKHKDKQNSLISKITQSSINNITSNIAKAEEERGFLEDAYSIINEYEYSSDNLGHRDLKSILEEWGK